MPGCLSAASSCLARWEWWEHRPRGQSSGESSLGTRGPDPPRHRVGLRGRALIHDPPLRRSQDARGCFPTSMLEKGSTAAPATILPPPPLLPRPALPSKALPHQYNSVHETNHFSASALHLLFFSSPLHGPLPFAQWGLKIATPAAFISDYFRVSLPQPARGRPLSKPLYNLPGGWASRHLPLTLTPLLETQNCALQMQKINAVALLRTRVCIHVHVPHRHTCPRWPSGCCGDERRRLGTVL